ncbi:MAG: UDP-2,3-diacylglucosamine diphosphatase [Cytophagaceae bacterium]
MNPYNLNTGNGKKIYFLSDFHLGAPNRKASLPREKKVIEFLNAIEPTAEAVFLLGDLFDFWFEYKYVIPKGFVRLQGKIAELTDKGIPVYVFTGNHDMWMFGYLEEELGVKIFREPVEFVINQKTYLIGHGDGLGPGDYFYKCMKWVFHNPFFQWIFKMVPPAIGMGIAHYWSGKSRLNNQDDRFFGEEEFLFQYCTQEETKKHRDAYIFGHRHLALDMNIKNQSRYVNIGDWIRYYTYATIDENGLELKTWEK